MVIIPFTKKRNIKGLQKPTLFDKTIWLTSDVNHLGVMLDKDLTLKKQLDKLSTKPIGPSGHASMFKQIWGLKLRVVYWIYTAAVRPIVTYLTTVWWPGVKLKSSKAELSKRMACLGSTGAL
jgi:hypothetical protein